MEILNKKPQLITGSISADERGKVIFANDFNFAGVKRFYVIENATLEVIRAFHGHFQEEKYVLVVSGKALVVAVEIDDPAQPSKDKEVQRFILSAGKPEILHIPAGYANGLKSLEENTKVIFFSTASLEDSQKDDYRFLWDYWGKEVWNT